MVLDFQQRRALARLLAARLPGYAERSRVATDAGVAGSAQLSGDPMACWADIVERAARAGAIPALLRSAARQRPGDHRLRRAAEAAAEGQLAIGTSPRRILAAAALTAVLVAALAGGWALRRGASEGRAAPDGVAADAPPSAELPGGGEHPPGTGGAPVAAVDGAALAEGAALADEAAGGAAAEGAAGAAGGSAAAEGAAGAAGGSAAAEDAAAEDAAGAVAWSAAGAAAEGAAGAATGGAAAGAAAGGAAAGGGTAAGAPRRSGGDPRAAAASSSGRCGGIPGEVIGFWYTTLELAPGSVHTVTHGVNVRADYPRQENGWSSREPIVCVLEPGDRVTISHRPIHVGRGYFWVPLAAGDLHD